MKKILYTFMLVLSTFLLTSCGSKQVDLSGSYYYAQSTGRDGIHAVHRLDIKRTDKTNKHYKAQEIGTSGVIQDKELGTLDIDGDLLTMSLPHPSNELDAETTGSVHHDISQAVGQKFVFKDDVISIGKGDGVVKFYKDNTDKGKEYMEIHTGRKSGLEENESSNAEDEFIEMDESGESEEVAEEVTFSDLIYDSNNATISGKLKNNTNYYIDSVRVCGTLEEHTTNGYGEDETREVAFDKSRISYGFVGFEEPCGIYHIEKGEKKDFTFKVAINEDASKYSTPKIDTSQTGITYRGKEDANTGVTFYRAQDSEYKMELIKNDAGDIEGVTIGNTSAYQWETLLVYFEYYDTYHDALRIGSVTKEQIDKGATVTFDNLKEGGGAVDNFGHVTQILYVDFQPRTQ